MTSHLSARLLSARLRANSNLDVEKISNPEGVFDSLESLPNNGIVADIEYLAAIGPDQQAGAIDKSVSQGLYRLKRSERSSFPVHGPPLGGTGLQGPHEVERDDAKHLPDAVGLIAPGRHAVEREPALELSVDLLVGAAAAHEEP